MNRARRRRTARARDRYARYCWALGGEPCSWKSGGWRAGQYLRRLNRYATAGPNHWSFWQAQIDQAMADVGEKLFAAHQSSGYRLMWSSQPLRGELIQEEPDPPLDLGGGTP